MLVAPPIILLISVLETWLSNGRVPQVYASVLKEDKQHGQSSLQNYGNQCIEECLQASGTHYRGLLVGIAEPYSQGIALKLERLLQMTGFTILFLPTYPFDMQQRYWVEGTVQNRSYLGGQEGRGQAVVFIMVLGGDPTAIEIKKSSIPWFMPCYMQIFNGSINCSLNLCQHKPGGKIKLHNCFLNSIC